MPSALSRRLWAGALVLLLLWNCSPMHGQQVRATEAQVKAVFLFNFGKYVTWPQAPESHFVLCILGQDPFGPILDSIVSNEKIGAKPLEVRRIRGVQEAAGCQIVFVSSAEESRARSIVEALSTQPVLTVSDMQSFLSQGGMIQFVTAEGRVRFLVNTVATQKAGLGVSSELLKVAKSVRTAEAGGVKP